jgi:purine catabolism regulator
VQQVQGPFKKLPKAGSVREALTVADVLRFPSFEGADVAAGRSALESPVDHVNVMQIPTDRFAKPNELVLAAPNAFPDPDASTKLIRALAEKQISAIAVRSDSVQEVLGADAIDEADRRDLVVIGLPEAGHLNEVQTTVLEHLVTRHTGELRAAAEVREALSSAALAGGGLPALASTVAELVDGKVWIFDAKPDLVAASHGQKIEFSRLLEEWTDGNISEPVYTDSGFVLSPISVAYRRLGCLVCTLRQPFRNVDLAALEHGATISALQLVHLEGADEAATRFRSGFIRDLLSGTLEPGSAGRRASSVDWDPAAPYRVVLVTPAYHREQLTQVLSAKQPMTMVASHGQATLLMIPVTDGSLHDELLDDIERLNDGIHIGVSAMRPTLDEFSEALVEAEEALRAAITFDKSTRVRHFDSLGSLRFLSAVPKDELRRFAEDTLRPLKDLDEEYRLTLEETLRYLIDANLNVAKTARDGGWHYNTLRYRIERLTELLGPFMEDGTVLDSVTLALILRQEVA